MVVDSILKCHGPKFNTLMSSFPGSLLRYRDPGFSFCVFCPETYIPKIQRNEDCFGIEERQKCKML